VGEGTHEISSSSHSDQAISMKMKITRTSESEFQVNVEGGTSFSIPVFSLFSMNVGGNAHYFESEIATSENEITVDMTFPGINLVSFGPEEFDMSPPRNWFWMTPIRDAIKNGSSDVSRFKFSPDPGIDFSKKRILCLPDGGGYQ
jgi:hypothetical protein